MWLFQGGVSTAGTCGCTTLSSTSGSVWPHSTRAAGDIKWLFCWARWASSHTQTKIQWLLAWTDTSGKSWNFFYMEVLGTLKRFLKLLKSSLFWEASTEKFSKEPTGHLQWHRWEFFRASTSLAVQSDSDSFQLALFDWRNGLALPHVKQSFL